ncbi:MAG: WD40 repeat domain-containing protein [Planctomycetota bacterium]
MLRPASLPHMVAILIASAFLLQSLGYVSGQETPASIKFRHESRGEGVADKCVAAHSPNRKVMVRVTGERLRAQVRLFDAVSDMPLGPAIELKAHRITALAVSPDNSTVATAIGNFSNDWGEVRVWNGKTGKEVAQYKMSLAEGLPPLGEVFRLSFSDDGETVTIISGPPGGK